jgi:methionine-gamma-lyase
VRQLEQKLAALEGLKRSPYASGLPQALITGRLSKATICDARSNYGGELTRDTLPRFGIEASFVDTTDAKAVAAEIRPNTRMLWLETPSNPTMQISDIRTLATLAHEKGVRDVVVDSTYATPIATKPLSLGADFVVHSLTKYIGGQAMRWGCVLAAKRLDALSLKRRCISAAPPFNAWLIMRCHAAAPHERTRTRP